MTKLTLPAVSRTMTESRLPATVEARWFRDRNHAVALAPDTEIGWFDM